MSLHAQSDDMCISRTLRGCTEDGEIQAASVGVKMSMLEGQWCIYVECKYEGPRMINEGWVGTQNKDLGMCASVLSRVSNTAYIPKTVM